MVAVWAASPAKQAAAPRRRPGAILIVLAGLLCWTWSTTSTGGNRWQQMGSAMPSALSFAVNSRLEGSSPGSSEQQHGYGWHWLPAGGGAPLLPPTCDLDVSTGPLAQSCRLVTDVCVDQVREQLDGRGVECSTAGRPAQLVLAPVAAAAADCSFPPPSCPHPLLAASRGAVWRRVQGSRGAPAGDGAGEALAALHFLPPRHGQLFLLAAARCLHARMLHARACAVPHASCCA